MSSPSVGVQSLVWLFLLVACVCNSSEAQTVYVTRTGEKYHVSSCHYLRYSKIAISLREAKAQGYTACSVCRPAFGAGNEGSAAQGAPHATDNVEHSDGTSSTVSSQCTAITKAGTRCKRSASSNGRCLQHQ